MDEDFFSNVPTDVQRIIVLFAADDPKTRVFEASKGLAELSRQPGWLARLLVSIEVSKKNQQGFAIKRASKTGKVQVIKDLLDMEDYETILLKGRKKVSTIFGDSMVDCAKNGHLRALEAILLSLSRTHQCGVRRSRRGRPTPVGSGKSRSKLSRRPRARVGGVSWSRRDGPTPPRLAEKCAEGGLSRRPRARVGGVSRSRRGGPTPPRLAGKCTEGGLPKRTRDFGCGETRS